MSSLREKTVSLDIKDKVDTKTVLVDGIYITNQPIRKRALSYIWAKYNMLPDNLTQSLGRLYDAVEEIYLPDKNDKSLFNYTHDKSSVYSRSIAEKNLTVKDGNVQRNVTETPRDAYNSWYGTPYQNRDYYNVFKDYRYDSGGKIKISYGEVDNKIENFSRIFTGDANDYDIIDHDKESIYEKLDLMLDNITKNNELTRIKNLKKPQRDDYETKEEYNNALKKFKADKKTKKNLKNEVKNIDDSINNFNDSPKNLLTKTAKLFSENKIDSLIGRFYGDKPISDTNFKEFIDTARSKNGNSRGRNLLKLTETTINGYDNPYCRVWTYHHQYGTSKNKLIRPFFDEKGDVKNIEESKLIQYHRSENGGKYLQDYSVLKNGFVKITPDDLGNSNYDTKRCMFSIENLAWKDVRIVSELSKDQIGPNGGRIMWFPPYDLSFQESSQAQWNETNFIGRGEPIYTYTNTKRTGSLSFTLLIDHPSIMNIFEKRAVKDSENEDSDILRFFAGCDLPMELNVPDTQETESKSIEPEGDNLTAGDDEGEKITFSIYFPNNYSGRSKNKNEIDEDWARYLLWGHNVDSDYNEEKSRGYEITENLGITIDEKNYQECSRQISGNSEKIRYYHRFDSDICDKQESDGGDYNDTTSNQKNMKKNNKNSISFAEFYVAINKNDDNVKDFGKKYGILNEDDTFKDSKLNYITHINDCKIKVIGVANKEKSKNSKTLAERRKNTVYEFLKNIWQDAKFTTDTTIDQNSNSNANDEKTKEGRRVDIEITYNLPAVDNQGVKRTPISMQKRYELKNKTNFTAPPTEAEYFENLEKIDNFAYQTIKDKIKYFEPAYHSISPEGFNSRLTFLHQCTRQGHTLELKENDNENVFRTAGNTAFGRPPFCILRIGDFINTKILIRNVNIVYQNGNGMQWDMNPEGIGIQPMFAKVTLQIEIIGGQSLDAPVSRLNNAVSFNYYANTGIYDNRSDMALYDNTGITYSNLYEPSGINKKE